MEKIKRLTLDCYEHGLLVRALYELWKEQPRESGQADALGDLILKVIDVPETKRFWRW